MSTPRTALGAVSAFLLSGCPIITFPDELALETLDSGYVSPVALVSPEPGTMLVVDQIGVVRELDGTGYWLDLRDRVIDLDPDYDERGLLNLVFDPDYEDNGWFYVWYSGPLRTGGPAGWDHTNYLSRFTVDEAGQADPDSEEILLAIDHPQFNNNGGGLAFGPDGNLYLSVGDGGNAGDLGVGHAPEGNGQSLDTLLGKVLRLDVSGDGVAIPSDNPFPSGQLGEPEIWAWGFRNPWRMSFDGDDLYVGDVGQDRWEEVSRVEGGRNYGWRTREGAHCFNPLAPTLPPLTCDETGPLGEVMVDPLLEYEHPEWRILGDQVYGNAVIGGFVYRGTDLGRSYRGEYIFGDLTKDDLVTDGSIFIAEPDAGWSTRRVGVEGLDGLAVKGISEVDGELYVLTSAQLGPSGVTGAVHQLVRADGTLLE